MRAKTNIIVEAFLCRNYEVELWNSFDYRKVKSCLRMSVEFLKKSFSHGNLIKDEDNDIAIVFGGYSHKIVLISEYKFIHISEISLAFKLFVAGLFK